jgi:hypothetical protein
MCAPCASLSGEKEKGGDEVHSMVRRARDRALKEKKGGIQYGDESEIREPTRVPGTEGAYCATRRGKCGTTSQPQVWTPP